MSENKCCGNCKRFVDKEVGGYGLCDDPNMIYGTHRSNKACNLYEAMSSNGWTEITPDNVDEVDCIPNDKVVIGWIYNKEFCSCSLSFFGFTLKSIAMQGGFYYYVLPELKINNE